MSKQLSPIDDLKNSITSLKPQIQAALPAHVSVDKFARVLMTAISTTPALAQANRNSLFGACLKLAQQGLLPDGSEAAIVTFKSKDGGTTAQAMPMLKGILKLVRNSGELASITANVVYENDEFQYWIDENGDHLKHAPNFHGDRGNMKLVYALAKTKDGATYTEVMSKSEIEKIRNSSRAKDSGPWVQWYEEMSKKSVLRRLAKRLPVSTDLDEAVRADDAMYDLPTVTPTTNVVASASTVTTNVVDETAAEVSTEPKKLKKLVKNYAPGAEDKDVVVEQGSEEIPI